MFYTVERSATCNKYNIDWQFLIHPFSSFAKAKLHQGCNRHCLPSHPGAEWVHYSAGLLAKKLKMYGESIIFSPASLGKQDNQGYDAFAPLIESGISLYVWSNQKFLSPVIYTCQGFDEKLAINTTKSFFKIIEIEFQSF